MEPLLAISPVDGRYAGKTGVLSEYFSEYALIRYRVRIEIEYFIALCELPLPQLSQVSPSLFPHLREIYEDFTMEDAEDVKSIEETTNHDVKAVEYFLKRKFNELGLNRQVDFIHFGLTSQDINNTAIPLAMKECMHKVVMPALGGLVSALENLAGRWEDVPMLAHTHGQPATPTCVGRELQVFATRLGKQLDSLSMCEFPAKFGGATGGMNAHYVAYPDTDWYSFANGFVNGTLGLSRSYPTTQIEHYDGLAAIFDNLKRIGTVMIDLSRDIWSYISMEYFGQKVVAGEVGSSTMPHKVNPIDFENAEGNLMLAGALFDFLSSKLPVSRMQRDLTDSTVLRNIGVPIAHMLVAVASLRKGLGKLILNQAKLEADLDDNWAVVSEGIQTILRREGYPEPYETLKALTRTGGHIDRETMEDFIDTLDVDESVREELRDITPFNYTGR